MHSIVSPDSIAPPVANYALAVRTVAAEVLLHTAGIVGVRPDTIRDGGRASGGRGRTCSPS
jgi:hypothetical protein